MERLFEQAPVPMCVADFSGTAPLLAPLAADYETILEAFERDSDLRRACVDAVWVTTANPASARLLGTGDPASVQGRLMDVLPPEVLHAAAEQVAAVASGRMPFRQDSIEVPLPGGRVVVELHLSMPDRSDWTRVIVAVIDRTNRVRAQERLRASEERFRAICEHAPVMIDQFDPDGNCVLWNRECELRLGWTQAEIQLHEDPLSLFYPEAEERQRVVDSIVRADGQFREYAVLAKGGEVRRQMWADLRLPSGQQISVGYDVTDQRAAETRQRAFEEQLRQTQKLESLGLMAGGIAHDFNNLLVGVLANADLARLKRPHDTELRAMLDEVVDAAQRAADLSRQLLAYSGGATFALVPLDMNALIEDLAPMIAASASKEVRHRYTLPRDLPSVEGDATQLRQVVFNLVLNASEALEDDAGTVHVRTALDEGRFLLEVRDDGVGMDEETRTRMFDPFFTTKFTGRGLGLASVLGIVRSHGGHIEVESTPGEGTVCRVWLSISDASPLPESSAPHAASRQEGLVLLVDDEASVRHTTQRLLDAMGYQTCAHSTSEAALAWFEQHPDEARLAVVDVTMPGVRGPELIRRLRERRPDLPALLVSGYAADSIDGLDPATTRFVQKPFTTATLSAALDAVL